MNCVSVVISCYTQTLWYKTLLCSLLADLNGINRSCLKMKQIIFKGFNPIFKKKLYKMANKSPC